MTSAQVVLEEHSNLQRTNRKGLGVGEGVPSSQPQEGMADKTLDGHTFILFPMPGESKILHLSSGSGKITS